MVVKSFSSRIFAYVVQYVSFPHILFVYLYCHVLRTDHIVLSLPS